MLTSPKKKKKKKKKRKTTINENQMILTKPVSLSFSSSERRCCHKSSDIKSKRHNVLNPLKETILYYFFHCRFSLLLH